MVNKNIRMVDPMTGRDSNAKDAVKYSSWYARRMVDPVTGKLSDKDTAITYAQWVRRR